MKACDARVRHAYVRWLAVAVALGAMLTCASALSAATADTITVGAAANGSRRSLHRRDVLVVRLRSNPSTGYSWRVCSGARPVLALAGRAYVPPKDDRLGAPGTAVLRFRAVATGKTVLRLGYTRPWEKDVAPAQTFTLRVTVV
jgi:inhibitor of cysteine peptidase